MSRVLKRTDKGSVSGSFSLMEAGNSVTVSEAVKLDGAGAGLLQGPFWSQSVSSCPREKSTTVQHSSQHGPGSLLLPDLLALVSSQVWAQARDCQEGTEGQQLLFHLSGHSRGDQG